MNPEKGICPNCQAEVFFMPRGSLKQCPECGAAFGKLEEPSDPAAIAMNIFKVCCWVFVFMLAIAGVGVAVMFVGCLASMTRM